jgi:ornithine carbamoyltransferase
MSARHFIDLWKLDGATLRAILDDAHARKAARKGWPQGRVDAAAPARDRTLAMIFQKNSTRTRFSFDAAIRQLGGQSVIATAADMQLGRGEPVEDTAKVLSRMVDAVMIRANSHEDVLRFAQASTVPVINGLTDKSHPCQIMADLLTLEEHRGPLAGKTIAWVGDGNNVCASFIHAAPKFGFELKSACPAV